MELVAWLGLSLREDLENGSDGGSDGLALLLLLSLRPPWGSHELNRGSHGRTIAGPWRPSKQPTPRVTRPAAFSFSGPAPVSGRRDRRAERGTVEGRRRWTTHHVEPGEDSHDHRLEVGDWR